MSTGPVGRLRALGALATAALLLTGCAFHGVNSIVLPGAKGSGSSGYEISVELPTAANLVPNSEVKVNDLTVGTVRSIGLDGWHARALISLENSVNLPADTTARVGQKSLLGAEYLELVAPTATNSATRLKNGSVIPLAHSGNYPETEDVLAALSAWLNGGGLDNVNTIVRELADTLGPTSAQARALVQNLSELTTTIAAQRSDLLALVDASDRLGGKLQAQTGRIGQALQTLSSGISTVSDETPAITRALTALDTLSSVGSQIVTRNGGNLRADIGSLTQVLQQVDHAGNGLPDSLDLIATILFPISRVPYVIKGDYLNFAGTIDLSLPALQKGLFPGATTQQAVALLMSLLGVTPPAPGSAPAGSSAGSSSAAPPRQIGGLLGGLFGQVPGTSGGSGTTQSGLGALLNTLLGGH